MVLFSRCSARQGGARKPFGRPEATIDYFLAPGFTAGLLGSGALLAGCSFAFVVVGGAAGIGLADSPPVLAAGFSGAFGSVAGAAVRAAGLAEVAGPLFISLELSGVIGFFAVTVWGDVRSVAAFRPAVVFPQPLSATLSAKGASAHFHILIVVLLFGNVPSSASRPRESLICAGTIPACRHTRDATLVPSTSVAASGRAACSACPV
jgi:hypothetical protein